MRKPDTVVYFRNGIGNFVMMTPAIRALAELDGSHKVDLCFCDDWTDSRMPAVRDIAENWDLINAIVVYPKERLRDDYKTYFWCHHTEGGEALNYFMSRQKPLYHLQRWGEMHEVDYYMEHVYSLGYQGLPPSQFVPVSKKAPTLPSRLPIIALGNGAFQSDMWNKKRWPHFALLAETLKRYFECSVVLVGAGKELAEVNRKYVDCDFVDKLSMTETASVLNRVDLFVTTDSGNMHIADALGTRLIALFGGTYLSKNRPLGSRAFVLRAGYPCQPCQGKEQFNNCTNYRCMNDLLVGEVMHEIKKRMRVNEK